MKEFFNAKAQRRKGRKGFRELFLSLVIVENTINGYNYQKTLCDSAPLRLCVKNSFSISLQNNIL